VDRRHWKTRKVACKALLGPTDCYHRDIYLLVYHRGRYAWLCIKFLCLSFIGCIKYAWLRISAVSIVGLIKYAWARIKASCLLWQDWSDDYGIVWPRGRGSYCALERALELLNMQTKPYRAIARRLDMCRLTTVSTCKLTTISTTMPFTILRGSIGGTARVTRCRSRWVHWKRGSRSNMPI